MCQAALGRRLSEGARAASGVLVPARHSLRAMESHPITRGSDEADSDAEPPARAASHAVSRAAVELEEVCTPRASEADAPSTPEPPSQAPSMTRSCCINPRRSSGGGEIRRVSFAGDDGACPQRGGAGGPASEGGAECAECSARRGTGTGRCYYDPYMAHRARRPRGYQHAYCCRSKAEAMVAPNQAQREAQAPAQPHRANLHASVQGARLVSPAPFPDASS